ncbi:MAG: hypothetical protein M1546_16570, partial [Chloroflexi bacterium]|nr:hypothetical protein [Chloroflexota bacterium]
MSEQQTTSQTEGTQQSQHTSNEAWQEVGKQFQALGESLATAFRTAWEDEQNRKRVQEMQKGVEAMVNEVGQAIKETAKTPQAQQAKEDVKKAAESMRVAGEQTMQEVRPHLVAALQQLNDELQRLIGRMEQRKS